MAVVAIVGTLTAIAVPAIGRIRKESQIKEAEIQLELFAHAIKRLQRDTGMWPGGAHRTGTAGVEVWDLSAADAGLVQADSDYPDWAGAYMRDVPLDPWGEPYFFDQDYFIGGRARVVVGTFGPNRKGRNVYDSDNIYVLLDD